MNIPALIGVPMDLNGLKTGMTAVVDGFSGQVIFEPEEDVRKETEKRMQEEAEKQKLLEELKRKRKYYERIVTNVNRSDGPLAPIDGV